LARLSGHNNEQIRIEQRMSGTLRVSTCQVAQLQQTDCQWGQQAQQTDQTVGTLHLTLFETASGFETLMIVLNGLITNDKFCMSRTARLQLSWWRLPRSARQSSKEEVQFSVEETVQEYLPQQETYEKTTMDHSAQLRRTA
jgi:hypothetical protein